SKQGSYFYYSLRNSNLNNTPSPTSAFWGGMIVDVDGQTRPEFIWKPGYSSTVEQNPKVKVVKFGDGYEQRIKDGINNSLIMLDVTFESRGLTEIVAIQHFLASRQSVESFSYVPNPPFNKRSLFVVRNWSQIDNFYGNYTVRGRFEETSN
ncbi:MAG: phage tail protein, partial [Nanoarchaeota archaeon]